MIESANIFYISNFNTIGGVETFLYEIAKKYKDYDITIIYKKGSYPQIKRLKKFVRVVKYNNQQIKCKRAFFNYETDIIDNIEAKEYIQIVHALWKTQEMTPVLNPKINKYFAVSETASKEWEEITGIKPEVVRNPLTITSEEKKDVLILISATRLTEEKGKDRMVTLGNILNNRCVNYLWLIFTNDTEAIDNPHIIYMKPTLDIRPYLLIAKGKGYGVQLSDSEGDCYLTRECEGLGIPLLVTPIPSFKEQGLEDGKNCYYLPFDMSNIDVDKIVNNIPKFKAYGIEDTWDKELAAGKSKYKEEKEKRYLVRARNTYEIDNVMDSTLGFIPPEGYEFEVDGERLEKLQGDLSDAECYVDVVKEIK